MKKEPVKWVDPDGREWRHGDRRDDDYIFRGVCRGRPRFVSQKAYDTMILNYANKSRQRAAEKRLNIRKKIVHNSGVSSRIRREVLDLHGRGKDYVSIAMRLAVPVSSVKLIIETLAK